jgi:hypothetical protein
MCRSPLNPVVVLIYIHNRFHLQRSICRYRSLTHSMSIPPFSCTYPHDIRVYQAVKDVGASYDALVDLFESIESFLSRLDICTKVPICAAMTDIVIKIMARSRSPLEDARCSGIHPCLSLVAASVSCSTRNRNRTTSIRPSLEARCNGVDCSKLREFTFSECSMTKTLATSCRPPTKRTEPFSDTVSRCFAVWRELYSIDAVLEA